MPLAFLTPDAPPASYVCRTIRIPADVAWLGLVNGALHELTSVENWEQFGELSPDETAAAFINIIEEYHVSSYCRLGEIFATARADVPDKALACDGSQHARADYPDLYDLLDAAFIVDGDYFVTPDLMGRAPVGAGAGSGLTSRTAGDTGGAETHQLSTAEMPSHQHPIIPGFISGFVLSLGGAPSPAMVPSALVYTAGSGNDVPHNNMQPFSVVTFCIWALP